MKHARPEFVPLAECHLKQLQLWLNLPHLQKWWRKGKLNLEEVREKYLPRIRGKKDACPFMVRVLEKDIGFIQYYEVPSGQKGWWPDDPGENVIGIDLFIGEPGFLGRGLGHRIITGFIHYLSQDRVIREVRIDPHPDNHRAIRCYEKAGFSGRERIRTPDGPAWMMVMQLDQAGTAFSDISKQK